MSGVLPPHDATSLVGRDRELAILRDRLAAALAGRGGLVLLSGEAGIGKTAIAEAVCIEAERRGGRALTGRCYDLMATPPYGPWTEARAQFPASSDLPPLPNALRTAAQTPNAFFAEVRDFFAAAAAKQPLVLLLDDLHWADPASLDLLRFIARMIAASPLLILGTYRPEDVTRHHPFSLILPQLVREARPTRLDLAPLPRAAITALVHDRYNLPPLEQARLVDYLARHTEGNALFTCEMLRALEERGVVAAGRATLGDVELVGLPRLLMHLVEGRVARLGEDAERLLSVAAIIGPEVSPELLVAVAVADETVVEDVVERALAAGLLAETRDGHRVAFAHALIRTALYEGMSGMRRRRLHRRAGEVLAGMPEPLADIVAYHFRQAGDPRAAEWLVRAGWRAYRALAYHSARARFVEALPTAAGAERARILLALATLDRYREQGIRYAEQALDVAAAVGDVTLAALAQFRLGTNLGYQNRVRAGLAAFDAAEGMIDTRAIEVPSDFADLPGLTFTRQHRAEDRAWLLAYSGRWREALALLGGTLEQALDCIDCIGANGKVALWFICGWLCRPDGMRRVIDAVVASYQAANEDLAVLAARVGESYSLLLPFLTDDQDARRRYAAALGQSTRRVEEVLGFVPPILNRCPLLIVSGRWDEAETLWAERRMALVNSGDVAGNLSYIGAIARAQGARARAWACVREGLPDGPLTEPGGAYFDATVRLQCLAARLALEDGDLETARQWLEAHDRWLTWAGPEVRWGRSDGRLAWAEYERARGEAGSALRHAECALVAAGEPRQPLALLTAHRLLGELHIETGRFAEAQHHLDQALVLADACAAPYERALTLLPQARLDAATSKLEEAWQRLDAVRAVCAPLGAAVALARADALAERFNAPPAAPAYPAGLSAREVEVLRLVAQGLTNSQVAERLYLSPRTVENHLRSIYGKLGVPTRAAAAHFAVSHGLA